MTIQAFKRLIGTSSLVITMLITHPSLAHARSPFSIFETFTGIKEEEEVAVELPSVLKTIDYLDAINAQEDQKTEREILMPIQEQISLFGQTALPIHAQDVIGISSYFSRFHPGIDIRAHVGTAIYPLLDGKVLDTGYERGGYGRYVLIGHNDRDGNPLVTLYAHLKEVSVKTDDMVTTKTTIGVVGMTGRTTGPHLHFEIHKGSKVIDPIKYLSDSTQTIIAKAR